MKPISQTLLRKFLRQAGDALSGQWVIVGGSVLPLLGVEARVTNDIDVVGPESSTQADVLKLMEIAQSLGLPVEAINQAAAYFVYRVKGWKKSLVLLHRGRTATFYRPNVNLFVELKLGRLSETDLADCLAMLAYARKNGERPAQAKLVRLVATRIKQEENVAKVARLRQLVEVLKKGG